MSVTCRLIRRLELKAYRNSFMESSSEKGVTELLLAWSAGDRSALNALLPLVHDELHKMARGYMRRERSDHTLQPTALINEAYLKLVNQADSNWQNRAHFFSVAAGVMREILIDHARHRGAKKRGSGNKGLPLDEALLQPRARDQDLLKLDEALRKFEKIDPEKSRIIELRFFGGLTNDETAEVLGVSNATIKRQWRTARAWLLRELD